MRFFHSSSFFCTLRIALFVLIAILPPSLAASAAVFQGDGGCAAAIPAPLNHKLDGNLEDGAQIAFVRLEIPSAGLLDLETSDLDDGNRTRVAFLGARCRPIDPQERSFGRHHLVEIPRAGSYYAAVSTNVTTPAARFVLRVGFAPGQDVSAVDVAGSRLSSIAPPPGPTGDDLDELVLDPGGQYIYVPSDLRFSLLNPLSTKGDDLDELVLDPGGNFIYVPLNMRFSLLNPLSGSPYTIRYVPAAVCPTADLDDHGDTLACATDLAPGSRLDAEIAGDQDDDHDTFTFTLKQRSDVVLATTAEIATTLTLLSAAGEAIAQGDAASGSLLVEATLEPGRYYLRVGSHVGAQGSYQLQIDAAALGR